MALGGIAALALLAAIGLGGLYAYSYLTTDRQLAALENAASVACANGRGEFQEPPDFTDIDGYISNMQMIEAQKEAIIECGSARVKIVQYLIENS